MKNILLFFFLLGAFPIFSQEMKPRNSVIGLNFRRTLFGGPDINRLYTADDGADVHTTLSHGTELQLTYSRKIYNRISLEASGSIGKHYGALSIELDEGFSDFGSGTQRKLYLLAGYTSFGFAGKYSIWSNKRNELGCLVGLKWVYYFPSSTILYKSPTFSLESSVGKKIFIAPKMGLFYHRKIDNLLGFGLRLDASYSSKRTSVISATDPYFDIIGKDIILHGTLKQKYLQFGLGIEATISF